MLDLPGGGIPRHGYSGLIALCGQSQEVMSKYCGVIGNARLYILWACREYTQAKLARHLGFSTSYLNDVIKGKRAITEAFVQRVIERGEMK